MCDVKCLWYSSLAVRAYTLSKATQERVYSSHHTWQGDQGSRDLKQLVAMYTFKEKRNNEYLCSAHILIFIQFGVAA